MSKVCSSKFTACQQYFSHTGCQLITHTKYRYITACVRCKHKTTTFEHVLFRKKERIACVLTCVLSKQYHTNAKHLSIFVSHKLDTSQSA